MDRKTRTLFGDVNKSIELLQRTQLDNEHVKSILRVGDITVTVTSNHPSMEAIDLAGKTINEIAENSVLDIKQNPNGVA